ALEAETDEEARKRLAKGVEEAQVILDRILFRQGIGDYFSFKDPSELPEGLTWETGMDQPEIGDPAARKGGTWNYYMSGFPPTLRPFGPEANNSFRSELYDYIELSQVGLHPDTLEVIPGLCHEWAVSEDAKTCYFRLDPEAAYNDGVPVKARDFMVAIYLRVSDDITAPYPKQYFREQFAQLTVYDDRTFAVTLPDAKPRKLVPYHAAIPPAAPHFYDEYGPDYEERYNWRVPPTTGAYFVAPGGIKMGAEITLTRAKDWWAKDRKYYRYMYNPDKLHYLVVRDRSKAWELFRAGQLDFFLITTPQDWYQKSEIPEVFNGYIERHWWYNQFPRPPWGFYLNTAKPLLQNKDIRYGLAHAMNWDKVLNVIFWGDYGRLPGFVSGYGDLVNQDVRPRPYSVKTAREFFAKAGFTQEGADGILKRSDGTRLQVEASYSTNNPIVGNMMAILKEEAKRAGVDLVLDGLEHMVNYRKEMKKEHEMAFSAWSFQPPYPRLYEYFHSRNAYDDKGNLKQQTNNVFSFADKEMDRLTEAYRNARSWDEKRELGLRIQEIIHEEAVFIPGFTREFERIACWRWMRWPDSEETRFAPRATSYPYESYVYWIDEEMKRETLEAMRQGKKFPEVERLWEDYRTTATEGGPE
ncbi:MAG: ABC transporter substrate-binding protein, partial [Akkermansiaceae bacterium]|nr:ABC transporter substrate-binding protein [Akkermansiaceae bacterium]